MSDHTFFQPESAADEVDAQQAYGEVTGEDLSTDDLVQDGSEVVEDADASADGQLASIDLEQPSADGDRLVSEQAGTGDDASGAPSDPLTDHTAAADSSEPVDPTGPEGGSAEDATEAPLADER